MEEKKNCKCLFVDTDQHPDIPGPCLIRTSSGSEVSQSRWSQMSFNGAFRRNGTYWKWKPFPYCPCIVIHWKFPESHSKFPLSSNMDGKVNHWAGHAAEVQELFEIVLCLHALTNNAKLDLAIYLISQINQCFFFLIYNNIKQFFKESFQSSQKLNIALSSLYSCLVFQRDWVNQSERIFHIENWM